MKKIVKLNDHFYEQATQVGEQQINQQIKTFASTLLDQVKCPLCLMPYMLSNKEKLPMILVQCGHTFCGECLKQFLIKDRVRCPVCLKLIKRIQNVEQLPINHTIYARIVKESSNPNSDKQLLTLFTIETENRLRRKNPPQKDMQSGFQFCCFHPSELKKYFCMHHDVAACAQCLDIAHNRNQCKIVDQLIIQQAKQKKKQLKKQQQN